MLHLFDEKRRKMKKKLKIGIVAPVQERVPSVREPSLMKYGGTERVVGGIVEGLVQFESEEAEVCLYAPGDSDARVKEITHFYPTVPHSIRTLPPFDNNPVRREKMAEVVADHVLERARLDGVDLIHNHLGSSLVIQGERLRAHGVNIPQIVTTTHGDLRFEEEVYSRETFRRHPFISISNSQRKGMPELNFVATVYNPVPTGIFDPRYCDEEPGTLRGLLLVSGKYLVWIGRLSVEKRPHIAIDVAVRLGMKLIMAGKREDHDRSYWEKEIDPRLEAHKDLVTFIGEVDDAEKNLLYRYAYAMLMPINWEEPFGLVVPEANACGTPVVAVSMGAMPEITDEGVSGFLVPPEGDEALLVDAIAEKVKRCGTIDRRDCRRHVEENFSIEAVTKKYLAAYRKVLSRNEARTRLETRRCFAIH